MVAAISGSADRAGTAESRGRAQSRENALPVHPSHLADTTGPATGVDLCDRANSRWISVAGHSDRPGQVRRRPFHERRRTRRHVDVPHLDHPTHGGPAGCTVDRHEPDRLDQAAEREVAPILAAGRSAIRLCAMSLSGPTDMSGHARRMALPRWHKTPCAGSAPQKGCRRPIFARPVRAEAARSLPAATTRGSAHGTVPDSFQIRRCPTPRPSRRCCAPTMARCGLARATDCFTSTAIAAID